MNKMIVGQAVMRMLDSFEQSVVSRLDAECLYRVLLGRHAESSAVIDEMIGTTLMDLVIAFVRSEEFSRVVFDPVIRQQPLNLPCMREPLDTALVNWLTERLALDRDGVVERLRHATSWIEAFAAIHQDGALVSIFGNDAMHGKLDDFVAGLRNLTAAEAAAIGDVGAAARDRSEAVPSDLLFSPLDVALLEASGLFDVDYYRERVPVMPASANPIEHYMSFGAQNYVSPGPSFDVISYLSAVPDSRGERVPVIHHLRAKEPAGRSTNAGNRWVGDVDYTDPDVHVERLHAASFFYRYNLGALGSLAMEHVGAAVRELASKRLADIAAADAPTVTVIIPVYGQLPFLLHCLDALAEQKSRFRVEVVVFDDCSPVNAEIDRVATIPWLRYVKGEVNRGFVAACNHAASLTKSDYIVLLNSDTRVCRDWLDELIGTFETFPSAGLVGSKLYNADGSLQEAGGIIWEDGSGWNYGRDQDPTLSSFSFARQVDYCSGAAIAIPTPLWDELGGFDLFYKPAYYEDVDLAFRVREAGREVWFQPLSRVIHYEGVTHGRDETKGVKASQIVNAAKFRDRWQTTIATFGANGVEPLKAANRAASRYMLALDAVTPTPDRDAGSVMTVKLLEIYQRLGWHVAFAPLHDPRFDAHYAGKLQRAGIEVLRADHGFRWDTHLNERRDLYDTICGFRVTVLGPIVDQLTQLAPAALVLFHDIDLHHLRVRRQAQLTGSPLLLRQAEVLEDEELDLSMKVDCSIVPSTIERKILVDALGVENVVVYPYTAHLVETALDLPNRKHIVFIGGFRHTPNVDAMEFFIADVWPALSTKLPSDAKLIVIGSDAPATLTRLAGDRIAFTGFVDDLGPILAECRVFVAPLRYGAGLKGKVVSSLSYGVPCVASAIAIEGMELEPEVHVLEANDATAFAEQVVRVYDDEILWADLRGEGYRFIEREYGWEAGTRAALEAIAKAETTWRERRHRRRISRVDAFRRNVADG